MGPLVPQFSLSFQILKNYGVASGYKKRPICQQLVSKNVPFRQIVLHVFLGRHASEIERPRRGRNLSPLSCFAGVRQRLHNRLKG